MLWFSVGVIVGVIIGFIVGSLFWLEDYVQLYGRPPQDVQYASTRLTRVTLRVIAALCAVRGDADGAVNALRATRVR